jgi:hypothetical protein
MYFVRIAAGMSGIMAVTLILLLVQLPFDSRAVLA